MTDPIYPEDFGAFADSGPDGGGKDNGPALAQALAAGAAADRPVVLGKSGRHYGVATTIPWHGAVGAALLGPSLCRRGPVDAGRGAWLWWTGATGGRLLEMYGMNCILRGLGLGAARTTTLDRLVDVDNPAALHIPYVTCTEHSFERCHFEGGFGPVAKGVVVGESGTPNNEFCRWDSCRFTNLGYAGIHVPNGTGQSKKNQVHDCDFIQCHHAWASAIASVDFSDTNFDACPLAILFNGGSWEPVSLNRCISENCPRLIHAWGVAGLTIRDCRLAPNAAPAVRPPFKEEWIVGGDDVLIEHCQFDTPTSGFYIRAGDNGSVTLIGTVFYSPYLPLAIDTPPRFSVASINSRYWTGSRQVPNGVFRQDNIPNPWKGDGLASQLAPLTVPPP